MNLANWNGRKRADLLDETVLVKLEGKFTVSFKVMDTRTRYGKWDLLLTPVNGNGTHWVNDERIQC